ncbi:MAG TPA: type IV pilus modification protein PilV [Gammaproteobacteria bacterium]|nr:type IV pilus modification protein PilV [Gammaproteobacteria bacterium]
MRTRSRKHSGFTLIEVLIAVVIFGVGLLTVASLQVVARKANFEAVQRTTATHLAQGMLERMRANRTGLGTYIGAGELVLGGGVRAAPATTCQDRASPCTATNLALADLWEWEQLLDGSYETAGGASVGGLVSPTACIRSNAAGDTGNYSVSVAWRGATASDVVPADDCGAGVAAYGAADEFRRVITVNTFINAL